MLEDSFQQFFDANAPSTPTFCQDIADNTTGFLEADDNVGPIFVVTSGGTAVPLEGNSVRAIENFSTGQRGAVAAEVFLRSKARVIFFSRDSALHPFTRKLRLHGGRSPDKATLEEALRELETLEDFRKSKRLLILNFVTLFDYLHGIRTIGQTLAAHQVIHKKFKAAFFVAAAVADYYIPQAKLPQHKVSSRAAEHLDLKLQRTPKMLCLCRQLCPFAYVTSFKLETDESRLLPNARASMREGRVDMVVANLLSTRRREALFLEVGAEAFQVVKSHNGDGDGESVDIQIAQMVLSKAQV